VNQRWKTVGALCTGLVVGAVGGRLSVGTTAPGVAPDKSGGLPTVPTASSISDTIKRAASGEIEVTQESLEVAMQALRYTGGAEQIAKKVIEEMPENEIESILASITKLRVEELRDVGDLRVFADRFAEIAMNGMVTGSEAAPVGVDTVEFGTAASRQDGPMGPADDFSSDEERIYAVFPTSRYDKNWVMVRWWRSDGPEVFLLQRYRVNTGDPYSYVWLKRPQGWDPGIYEVEVYAADQELTPLAWGQYSISE
jgi:hypothetical protein